MTTHWNYRVVKTIAHGITSYQVHEVYYTDDKPIAVTESSIAAYGETVDELKADFELIMKAFDAPVLNYEDFDDLTDLSSMITDYSALDI